MASTLTRRDAAQTELHGDPQALNAIGRAVEAAGYDYLLMFDHVAGAVHEGRDPPMLGPYTEKHPPSMIPL